MDDHRAAPDPGPAGADRTTTGDETGAPRAAAGLDLLEADTVVARLSALTQAARVFGSGVADVDLDIGWTSPGRPERMVWATGEGGRRRVELRLDLDRMVALAGTGTSACTRSGIEGFQSAFLHELGHVLFSSRPPGEALLDAERCSVLGACLSDETRRLAQQPRVRQLLNDVGAILEDARVERRLTDRFRGARRYLRAHAAEAVDVARGVTPGVAAAPASGKPEPAEPPTPAGGAGGPSMAETVLGPGDELALGTCAAAGEVVPGATRPAASPGDRQGQELSRLVALLYVNIAGLEDEVPPASVPAGTAAAMDRLREPLMAAALADEPDRFTDWLVTDLLAELAQSFPAIFALEEVESAVGPATPGADAAAEREADAGEEAPEETAEEQGEEFRHPGAAPIAEAAEAGEEAASVLGTMAERLMSPGLLGSDARVGVAGEGPPRESPLQPRIIVYPHMDGTLLVDEVAVANARSVPPTVQSRQVLDFVNRRYGPPALEAFAAERAALRRAFEVNFERRFAGRYRTGRRVGVRNLRRMSVSRDLRLFQKLEVPDRLSYYFHLLIDVSPSMLTDRNAAKAIAVGYAFTEALDRLRVPVDVSLYSAAITELYDHRRDRLDLFFGAEFGYYSSGTHEIEAIAYAKQKADAVDQTRKLIVVLTDGHPNSVALHRAGSADLRAYYRSALIPWLRAVDVDLLAIGIGHSPAYHENAVAIGSSWQSITVFMRLLDGVIAEGRKSHAALWT